jgi:hypothetical protein
MQDLNLSGLDVKEETVREAMKVDLGEWEEELVSQQEWFDKIGKTLPRPLALERELLLERVKTTRRGKGAIRSPLHAWRGEPRAARARPLAVEPDPSRSSASGRAGLAAARKRRTR